MDIKTWKERMNVDTKSIYTLVSQTGQLGWFLSTAQGLEMLALTVGGLLFLSLWVKSS